MNNTKLMFNQHYIKMNTSLELKIWTLDVSERIYTILRKIDDFEYDQFFVG